MSERIPEEKLKAVRAAMARRVAAMLLQAMAHREADFDIIADRLGKSEEDVREWVTRFIDAETDGESLSKISDFLAALWMEPRFELGRVTAAPLPDPRNEAA